MYVYILQKDFYAITCTNTAIIERDIQIAELYTKMRERERKKKEVSEF